MATYLSKDFANSHAPKTIAVVFAAHGETGGDRKNASLAEIVEGIRKLGRFKFTSGGVLNGAPSFSEALKEAAVSGATEVLVYPLFMSSGYFVDRRLVEESERAKIKIKSRILTPLGEEVGLQDVVAKRVTDTMQDLDLVNDQTHVVVVGHGSKSGAPQSAKATRKFAEGLRAKAIGQEVSFALLEEAPVLHEVLATTSHPVLIVGFFFAPGLHGGEDVPAAMLDRGIDISHYIGSIGGGPEIQRMILESLLQHCQKAVP